MQNATLRLNAPQFTGAYAERTPVSLSNLALNAYFQRDEQGLQVQLDSLALNLGETRWESRVQVQQRNATEQQEELWHVQADRLDLKPITPILDALAPLPEGLATAIDRLKVTGGLRNVLLDYRPQNSGDQRLSFAANLDRVGFDAYHGAPAARNVSGSISGDLGKGELRMDSKDFSLHLYPIFAKPWQYIQANATLTWKLDKEGFTLIAPYLKVLGEEGKIAGDFLIRLHFDHSQEDYMDLRVGLVDGDGRYTAKYLPQVLNAGVDEWLRTAILKGAVDQGFFQYQGSLNHDAVEAARSISLFFKVHDTELAFQPGWPHLTKVSGDVFIEDSGVRIVASKGQLLDTKVRDVFVNIPHAASGQDSHMYIDGAFAGGLGDGVKILQEAPIGTGSTFAGWHGEGELQGKLDLDIPLVKGQEPKIVVAFKTDKARLKLSEPELELTQLKGDFRFDSAKGLSGEGISAQAFERPVTAQIFADGKPGKPNTRVVAKGQVAVKKLTDWLQVGQPLPVSGEVPYQLQLNLDGADSQLMVSSSLKGVAVDLPAPFGMAASTGRNSVFRMTLQGAERRYWFNYGELADFTFAAPSGKLAEGRGELFLGDGAALLPPGKGCGYEGFSPSWMWNPGKPSWIATPGRTREAAPNSCSAVRISRLASSVPSAPPWTRSTCCWRASPLPGSCRSTASRPKARSGFPMPRRRRWPSTWRTCACRLPIRQRRPMKMRPTPWLGGSQERSAPGYFHCPAVPGPGPDRPLGAQGAADVQGHGLQWPGPGPQGHAVAGRGRLGRPGRCQQQLVPGPHWRQEPGGRAQGLGLRPDRDQ